MSKTLISWTDETANWIVGCSKISQGCRSCYAATAANSARLQQFDQYKAVVDGHGNWNGKIEFVPKVLEQLLKGKRSRRVFAPSMSDPFHPGVKDEWLIHFLATVALTPHITYQILSKRADRMLDKLGDLGLKKKIFEKVNEIDSLGKLNIVRCPNGWPFPNVHFGVTAENQAAANDRIPLLLQTPAAVRFVSVEPMLEEMNLLEVEWPKKGGHKVDVLRGGYWEKQDVFYKGFVNHSDMPGFRDGMISWVIIGGESGPGSRPFHLEWAQFLIEQCRAAGVRVFMKQVGSNAFYQGQPFKTKSRAGSDPSEWPAWARVQEFPETKS